MNAPGSAFMHRALAEPAPFSYNTDMDELRIREQVDLIREVFSYQSRFDGKTIVLKIDYPVIESANFPTLIKDLAMLRQTGIQIVIVPGSTERIDEVLDRYGVKAPYSGDIRISSSEAIPFIKMAAFDVANRFMTLFSAHRVTAVVGNFVKARSIGVISGVDFQQTGKVDRILAEPVLQLMSMGQVPVFPCIGWSSAGKPYNLSSDELALAVAESLNAVKLFFVSPGPGLSSERLKTTPGMDLSADGRVIRLTLDQAEKLCALNPGCQDIDFKRVELAAKACRRGVERVHIVDGSIEGVILKELFSALGIGTMVYSSPSDSFRPMKAKDISEVLRLMRPLVEKGILKRRTEEDLREKMADYVVCDSDGIIQACGALHLYPQDSTAEIAAIAVNPAFSQLGLGKRIVAHLIEKARSSGLASVFVLTTQTQDWFESLGFREAYVDELPPAKKATYDQKRKSEIYILDISSER
jgi:amino-acid N-acetyltransferase